MAAPDVLPREEDLLSSSLFDHRKGENVKSRRMAIEQKIEFLENLTGKVSNRRSRRWLNDRLLMELVPRLHAEEIRGLFAPPPWGDDVRLSPFCMTNGREWDNFRNIDMDKEATMIEALEGSSSERKYRVDADKMAVLTAWQRVDCRTRDALRRSFHLELINGYEVYLITNEANFFGSLSELFNACEVYLIMNEFECSCVFACNETMNLLDIY